MSASENRRMVNMGEEESLLEGITNIFQKSIIINMA